MKLTRIHEAQGRSWPQVCRRACPVLLVFLCLLLSAYDTAAQRNPTPAAKPQPTGELSRLNQEKEEIRAARLKLFQEQSTFHNEYYKPLDRLRRQLDLQQADLYEECGGEKYGKNAQFCSREMGRFNEDVRYYNERIDDLKARFASQQVHLQAKSDDLDRKEKDLDRRLTSFQGTRQQ